MADPASPLDPKAPLKHPQDEHGHFIHKDPGQKMGGLLHTSETDDDSTLVDVRVANPLHRIAKLLQDIKSHQSTTVSMRFTIPLIALPIVLLVAFQLGRAQTSCSPLFSTQTGIVRLLSLEVPKENTSWFGRVFNYLPGNSKPQKTVTFTRENRAVLMTSDGQTLTLLPAAGVKLAPFANQGVIVTGDYSACNRVITVDNAANISAEF